MHRLAIALRYYIVARCNSNPAFKGINIVLSDASVPGEGEHKIMGMLLIYSNNSRLYSKTEVKCWIFPEYSPRFVRIGCRLDHVGYRDA
jgi:5'-3' exonuclease